MVEAIPVPRTLKGDTELLLCQFENCARPLVFLWFSVCFTPPLCGSCFERVLLSTEEEKVQCYNLFPAWVRFIDACRPAWYTLVKS